ncbi:MAG: hypothetical protein QXY48_02250 [Sulfolobales archaeon]
MSFVREISSELNKVIAELKKALSMESLDVLIAQSEVRDLGGTKVVVKRFTSEIGLLKWLPPAILLRASYPFALTPRERFKREKRFMEYSGWQSFRLPKIYSVDEEELVVVREFIDGLPLKCDRLDDVVILGRVLAEIHSKGFSMGDVKPTNFLVSSGVPYVIDAEQSTPFKYELGSWDIAVAAFFIALANYVEVSKFRELFEEFSKAYLQFGGSEESYCELLSPRNAVVITFMPLPNTFVLYEVQKSYCS